MFKFKQLRDVGLCLLLLLTTASAWSQVSAYSFTQSATTYTPITGGTVVGTGSFDNNSYTNQPIGFPFIYNGVSYTAFSINADGFIALGTTISSSYTAISEGLTSNVIAAYNDDLQGLSANGEIRFETIGTTPNRKLVVQFSNLRHYGTTGAGDNLNFQIVLSETTNTVGIVYGSVVRNSETRVMEVGLSGSTSADYNNRTSTTDWAATTAGTSNSANVTSTAAIIPASGLSFLWTPSSCGAPSGLNVTATSATDGLVGWTALATGTPTNGYDWEIVPSGNAQGVGVIASGNATTNSAPFTGLASFTAYTLYVRSNCGGIQSAYASYNFTFCSAGLPGNGLVNAVPVLSSSFTYNFPASDWICYGNNLTTRSQPDVYFRIVADSCASSITVSTCNTTPTWDNYMTILAANGTTVIGTADDICGSLASYTFTPIPGATYYAVVEPYGATTNGFRLDVTQTAGTPTSTLATTTVSSTCPASTDGSVTVSATGGKMPFTYVWSNGVTQTLHSTSATITGLAPGTYTVSVTNGCGGTAAATATATVTSVFSFTGVATPTSCNGTVDGAVDLTLTGATNPSFVWSNGATTEDLAALVAGTYNVTITSGTCVSTASYAVTQPPLGVAAVSESVTCGGETVTLSLSGQSAGSPFVWQASADGVTGWINLLGGTVTPFQVSPADTTYYRAFFCGSTPTNVVVVNAFVVNSPIAANVTRCGPGSITVTATGSNVRWFATPTSSTSLANGASYTTNITSTTTFYAEASGGGTTSNVGPLSTAIGSGAQQTSNAYLIFDVLQDLTLQTVDVFPSTTGNVVINLQNSAGTVLQTLTYNIATLPASGGVTVPVNFTIPAGTGYRLAQGNGSISMFRNDGGVSYPYTLPSFLSITGSDAGSTYYYFFYNWSVSTACTSARTAVTATVTTPPAITLTAGTPAVCAGLSTALTITSANTDYTYSWAAASSLSATSGATVTATPAVGTVYAVTASDANTGCQATANVSVGVNPLPSVSAAATPVAVCPGTTVTLNGTVANLPVGTGTVQNTTTTYPAPYGNYYYGAKHQFLIRASELQAAGVNPGNINGLSFSVVSTNGVALNGFEIQMAPTALTALTTTFVNSGFTVVSPAATYTPIVGTNTHNFTTPFNWDGISNIIVQTCFNNSAYTLNAVFNQTATSYASSLRFNDDAATVCSNTTGTTANQRPNMTFLTTPTYSYAWTPSAGLANATATTTTVVPAATGTYTFAVTNTTTGCSATAATTVTVFSLPTVTASATDVLCNGAANGTATATAANGTAPYTYAWSNGGTTATITGLSGGTYTVSVTDANNCVTATASVSIFEPAFPLTLDAAILTPVSCFGGANGAIDIAISGGTTPYYYAWSNGATTQDVNVLVAGSYTGTVTDDNGCILIVGPAIVTQPAALTATSTSTNVTCNAAANGTIDITVTGGTMPYNYAWSNGAVSEDLVNLVPNTYTCFITDANGCTSVAGPVTITEPAVLAIPAVGVSDIVCNGAANGAIDIDVTGGTLPYTYAWSNGATTEDLANLVPGTYSGTVTDANGCTAFTGAVTIVEPTAIVITADIVENVSCNASNDGRIVISVSGGTMPYSFAWSNGATTQDLNGLAAGTYDLTVTDAAGCSAVLGAITITEPTAIVITAAVTNVSCNAGTNGAVDLTVTGGVPAYTYAWSNSATSEDLTGLVAGAYDVTVTDATGCTATLANTVAEPTLALQLGGLPTITNVTCNSLCNGSLSNVVIVGGTTPYTYSWVGPNNFTANTANLSNLCAGVYTGTVTDANGCTYTPPVALTITQPDALVVTLTPTDATSSDVTITDGSVASLVSGGVPAYTYSWSNTISTANLTGVAAGSYTVSVTDANGCVATAVTTVGPPTGVVNVEGVNNFNMFPNPTAGNVTITFDLATAQNVEMSIFNVNGQLVKYAESGAQSNIMFNLDLSSFTGGVYMARFTVGGETFTKQIVLVK